MSMTITSLRHHRAHLANALVHVNEIVKLEQTPPSEMALLALENHDDLMHYELRQASEAIDFCHRLNATNEAKRQHIARIACIRLGNMARQIAGSRLP